jgi:tripartite-type tricarboxylate transporter receptor subunit TctC
VLVGFPAGTAPDVAARILADKLAILWGKAVIVENITGASGNIATDRAAKAAPDGYTLFMGGNSSLIMSVSLFDKLPFDPVKDFIPITQIFVAANLLVVHPDMPVKSIADLVALAKAKPGEADLRPHRHWLLAAPSGRAVQVYDQNQHPGGGLSRFDRGAARPARGPHHDGFTNVVNAAPLVKEGKLRAFAVPSRKRSVAGPTCRPWRDRLSRTSRRCRGSA